MKLNELHAVGGGARSEAWLQLKADICHMRLRVPRVTEAACLGAAILAAVAAGDYPDVRSAVNDAVNIDHHLAPKPESSERYNRQYESYKRLYPALQGIFRQVDGI